MKHKKHSGIHRRILTVVIPLIMLSTFSSALIIGIIVRNEVWDIHEKSVITALEAIAGEIRCRGIESEILKNLLVTGKKGEFRHFVVARQGKLLFASEGTLNPERLVRQGEELVLGKDIDVKRIGMFGRVAGLLAAIKLNREYTVILFEDAARLNPVRWKALITIFLIIVVAIASVIVAMTWLVTGPVMKRLHILKSSISAFAAKGQEVKIPPEYGNGDEFSPVFEEFNRMADTILRLKDEKIERAEKEKRLFAQLAHDINTPIAIIRANAENLREYSGEIEPSKKHRIYTSILEQSILIQSLVEDLLTLASVRTSSLALHLSEISLDELLDSVVDTFQPVVEERGIVIVADGYGLSAWADPLRLRQILINLVKNAVVHGKTLTLIEIDARAVDRYVVIKVMDDGDGIREEDLERIFEGHGSTNRNGSGGWGIGLSIVKMLAELQGGQCRALSSDKGAVFEVVLPLAVS